MRRTVLAKATSAAGTIPPRFKHQNYSLTRCRESPLIFDASDPGTGKTRVQIDAFSERRRKRGKKALVLATKSLLDSAWKCDFHKYAPDMVVSVAYATNRKQALSAACDVVVTNHDAVKDLVKYPESFWKEFDTIIVDESTAFKHHTSQRSKALAKLSKYFKYRTCMSGTPTSNGILDIWHQVLVLDEGKRLGKSFYGFRASACEPKQVGPAANMVKWEDKEGVDLAVAEILKDITIRHQFDDCVDIPENHRYAVTFTLPKKLQSKYDDMQDFHFVQLKAAGITAVNGAVVYGKLLQIASGAVYDDSGSYSLLDRSRYDLILDLVEEREHSIVFFSWEHQRNELIKEAKKRGVSHAVFDGSTNDRARTQIVQDYQEGKYQVLFAHPQSAGHGLTLTRGTATIWASPTYNLEHFLQGLKRVHRIGQVQRTETIVVVAEGTIDEKVWDVLQSKDSKQGDFMKLLKEEIK
jgi:SNF2 family DNA or RNA helicase